MNAPCLLLLGADQPLRERAIVAALRSYCGPIATVSQRGPLLRDRHLDHVWRGNPFDAASTLAAVRAAGVELAAVVPLSEMTLHAGAAVATAFGLPYLSPACLALVRHKGRMKERLRARGIAVPRFAVATSYRSLAAAAAGIGYPVVVKPTEFGGSEGVTLAKDAGDLARAYEHAARIVHAQRATYGFAKVELQVEEYIASEHEVSVEVVLDAGEPRVLAVTDKSLSAPPFFAEMGHCVPSVHSDDDAVRATAVAACRALEIDRGVAHVEMRLTPTGPVLMEVGARTGGDAILDLVERVTGVSPYALHIASYLARGPLPALPPPRGRAAIAFLKAPAGRVLAVRPPPPLPPAVVSLEVTARVGALSEAAHSARTREGVVELHWHDEEALPPGREQRHIELAAALSASMLEVQDVAEVAHVRWG